MPQRKGEAHHKAKLTDKKVREIREAEGSLAQIARAFGVGKTAVWKVRNGRTWRHVEDTNAG